MLSTEIKTWTTIIIKTQRSWKKRIPSSHLLVISLDTSEDSKSSVWTQEFAFLSDSWKGELLVSRDPPVPCTCFEGLGPKMWCIHGTAESKSSYCDMSFTPTIITIQHLSKSHQV